MEQGSVSGGFRLTLGTGVLVALLLFISALSLEWRYFEAYLAAPTSDSIVAVFGGVSLVWSESCNKYSNTTLNSGLEFPAAYICFVRHLNMSDSTPNMNLDTHNSAIEAVVGLCILACVLSIYILMFAPLKRPDMLEMSMQARSAVGILATTASGATITVGTPHSIVKVMVVITYWHDLILTVIRLEYYIPLLLLPPVAVVIVLCALYSTNAENANAIAFIRNHTGIDCNRNCASFGTLTGRGIWAVMGASTTLCMASLSAILRLVMPRCCPRLIYGGFPRAISDTSVSCLPLSIDLVLSKLRIHNAYAYCTDSGR
jgi:hypothetical protein